MEKHLVSLKVLRLSRPVIKYTDITCEAPVPQTTLALPASVGNIYVGEQFSCMLSINRDDLDDTLPEELSQEALAKDIRVKIAASMQLPHGLGIVPVIHDSSTQHILNGEHLTWQQTIHYETKHSGLHILNITITYQVSEDSEPIVFRKNYRFNATPAVQVKTKITELAQNGTSSNSGSSSSLIEAQIENVSNSCLTLEAIDIIPSEGWTLATMLNQQPSLLPKDVWQSLFLFKEQASKNKRSPIEQSKLTLCWRREPLGEKGWLATASLATTSTTPSSS